MSPLSTDDIHYSFAQFFLVRGTGTVYTDSSVSVLRQRFVGDGFHEDLTVMNHGREPVELEVRVDVGADFADLFEVKDAMEKKGTSSQHVEGSRIVLRYTRERYVRETWISATAREAELDEGGVTFRIRIDAQGSWSTCLDVVPAVVGRPRRRSTVRATATASRRRSPRAPPAWRSGSRARPTSSPRGARSRRSTRAASSTSLLCGSIPPSCARDRRSPRRASRGSWRCSAATASSRATRRCRTFPSSRRRR